ncbi:hypothetical protein [Mycobacterium kubicae]|uniref:hypothetical protein n=1 Tax=Mycobacterium kubicae TaxID=120959 RepID=UPI0013F4DDE3|nr:hypothetical protein [Mycobacterium kubicae]
MGIADVEEVIEEKQARDHDDRDGPDNSGNTHRCWVSSQGIGPAAVFGTVSHPLIGAHLGGSRGARGPASFRHRLGIRFRNIFDLASHLSLAIAKLCAPGDDADRNWVTAHGGKTAGSQGGQGSGWEAW